MWSTMKKIIAPFLLLLSGCGSSYPPLDVVDRVDLSRYVGRWYEIARLPNSFQKNCWNSTAEYSFIDDETVRVINRCRKVSPDGEPDEANGKAWVVEGSNNAKLKVSFFWPFKGDYWIIDLDSGGYAWAVVGAPSREYLWILCREPKMENETLRGILQRARSKGFDTSAMVCTNSSMEWPVK